MIVQSGLWRTFAVNAFCIQIAIKIEYLRENMKVEWVTFTPADIGFLIFTLENFFCQNAFTKLSNFRIIFLHFWRI